MVDEEGINLSAGNNVLYAVLADKRMTDKTVGLSVAQTKNEKICTNRTICIINIYFYFFQ